MTAEEAIELLVRLPIVTMKLRDFPGGGYMEAVTMGIRALEEFERKKKRDQSPRGQSSLGVWPWRCKRKS